MGQTNKYKLPYPEADDDANVPFDMKNLAEKIEDISYKIESTITDAYDPTKTYAVNDYCIYNNILYKCITAVTVGEEFDESKWEATNIAKEVESLDTKIDTINVTTAGTDLNNYVDTRKYWFGTKNAPTNRPSYSGSGAGYLEVASDGDAKAYVLQKWYKYNSSEQYTRRKVAGIWGNWEKILNENNIAFAKAGISDDLVLSSNNYEQLKLTKQVQKEGNLTITNNGIKIGKGINKIKITAKIYWYTPVTFGLKNIQVRKNDAEVTVLNDNVDKEYEHKIMCDIIDVSENDMITLWAKGKTNDLIRNYSSGTFLIVEKMR